MVLPYRLLPGGPLNTLDTINNSNKHREPIKNGNCAPRFNTAYLRESQNAPNLDWRIVRDKISFLENIFSKMLISRPREDLDGPQNWPDLALGEETSRVKKPNALCVSDLSQLVRGLSRHRPSHSRYG